MKILWITNILIGDISEKSPMHGLWMDALLKQLKKEDEFSFVIVTSSNIKSVEKKKLNDIMYYVLPGGLPVHYKRDPITAYKEWKAIFDIEKPDVIQLWGTEYSHAISALQVAKDLEIPSVIYIQGIMKAISRFATGQLPLFTMLRNITLRDIYRNQLLIFQKSWFKNRTESENHLISLSGNVVVENMWAELFCKSINPKINVFKIPLNINEEFSNYSWSLKSMKPHTIICNASGPAYKGLHVLLEALVLVRKRFPDVKLYVPGKPMNVEKGWLNRQKVPGYQNYVSDFIKYNELKENIIFTGYLEQNKLADLLAKSNVYVLSSAIENHSSSLKESMIVGTPSVVSLVGGVPEYFSFGYSGFSYRFGEYECLAGYICELFDNKDLCLKFSTNSREKAKEIKDVNIKDKIVSMYIELNKKGVSYES